MWVLQCEINGRPRLMCMTRMSDVVDEIEEGGMVEIRPMKALPLGQGSGDRCLLEL